jgi:DtxR family Mn-dependent transcriptional regulator
LTQQGRSYALRVLRTHRLWERYLADRTGVSPSEWHPRAEEQEHLLGAEETEALSATLGHPLVDPHGDPIPTSAGELPAALGVALPSLEPGESGRVVHVEDEPAEAWARIEATGLAPGAVITRLPGQGARVRFRLGAAVHELDALVAAGVTVEPAEAEPVLATGVTMADLQPGESARVVALDAACQGPQRRRLLDLGVVPGTQIAAEFAAASGEPVAYRIRGALIALRRRQAAWVHVERVVAGAGGEGAGSGADRVTTGASG